MKRVTISIFQTLLHEATRRRGIIAELAFVAADGKRHTKQLRRTVAGTPFQAEATAVVMALDALREPCSITIVTGSSLLAHQTPEARTINGEFWRAIDRAAERHEITWQLVAPARPRYPETIAS